MAAKPLTFSLSLSSSSLVSPLLFKSQISHHCPKRALFFPKTHFVSITYAKTKHQESSSNSVIIATTNGSDEDSYIEFDEQEKVDEDDDEFLAFEDMRTWELNKPIGFGEGKFYDTSVEEKLLEEMEKERLIRIEAEKKKKLEESLKKKNEIPEKKEFIPTGPTVRLGNLPKKKNIHRDLQIAFKGFNGIIKISPSVIGNLKTRDPICKGFAFVEFVSDEAALRFVNMYSKQDILFGKIQKKISFDIVNPEKINSNAEALPHPKIKSHGRLPLKEEFIGVPVTAKAKEIEMPAKDSTLSHKEDSSKNPETYLRSDENKQITAKKKVVKKKPTKVAKLSLPGSLGRLKTKERSVLTGVFSKYGGKVASLSK